MRALNRNQIVISVPKDYESIKDDLRELAEENNRTLSNYVLMFLVEHVKNNMSGKIPKSKHPFNSRNKNKKK